MSSDPLSNVTQPASRARRVGFCHPISSTQTSPSTTIKEQTSPLETAIAVSARYIATLHGGLTAFLMSLSQAGLVAYSDFHHYTAKNKEMRLNPHHIPTSIKKLKLTLQPLDEVKESEGVKALQSEMDAEFEELHRRIRDKYFKPLEIINSKAYQQRFHFAVLQLLRRAAQAFIAQLNLHDYDEDTALVDLLTTRTLEPLKAPLPTDTAELLLLYKKANHAEISQLPQPTKYNENTATIINTINEVRLPVNSTTPPEPLNTIITNDTAQSPSSSMTTQSSNNHTTTDSHLSRERSGTTLTTPGRLTTVITPQTVDTPDPSQLPPFSELLHHRPTCPLPTTTPPGVPRGIRGTEFATAGSALAQTLINNLASLQHQFTDESELEGNTDGNTQDKTADIGFTTQDDTLYQEIDLDSIEKEAAQRKLLKMLQDVYINTIKLPIDEFHSAIIQREELIRIKRVTSSSLKSSVTAKVALKIQAERPADRPVLSGLIREETEKKTSVLQNQLKSALDQLTHVQSQQRAMIKQLQLERVQPPAKQNNNTSKKQRGSNKNRIWSSTTNGLPVAAATSQAYPTSTSVPTITTQQPLSQQWGRKRSLAPSPSTERVSPTVGDNASSAARRSRNTKNRKLNSNSRLHANNAS